MASNPSILTPDVIRNLDTADRKLSDLIATMDAAERCGIDISQLRQTHAEMRRQISQFRENFFGGTLPR